MTRHSPDLVSLTFGVLFAAIGILSLVMIGLLILAWFLFTATGLTG